MLSEWQKQPFWWLRQSPNYRITELRKDLWRSSCPTSLLKEESIRVGHPGPCPVKFLVSPSMVTLWATCFSVSPQTVKKFSSIFKCNFLFCNLCLLFLVLSLNITVNLSLSSLHSLIRYLYALIRFFSAFSSLSETEPFLSALLHMPSPLKIFIPLWNWPVPVCPCLSCSGKPSGWHSRSHQNWPQGKDHFL